MRILDRLAQRGHAGPIPVLSRSECRAFLKAADSADRPAPLDWDKGCAVTSRVFYELATHPKLMEITLFPYTTLFRSRKSVV